MMHTGKVAWFCSTKGFGFLSREGAPNVFVHRSSIQSGSSKELKDGEDVEFETELGPDGKDQVSRVKPIVRVCSVS
jgi:CspA family cold shock protein